MEQTSVMKAMYEFAMADPDDCEREWAAYLALVSNQEKASISSPTASTSSLHSRVGAFTATVTASSTSRSTARLRVPRDTAPAAIPTTTAASRTVLSAKHDSPKDDLSPGARRIYDLLVGGSSTPTSTAPLPVRSSVVPISGFSERAAATPSPTKDDLSPEARLIYDYIVGNSNEFASLDDLSPGGRRHYDYLVGGSAPPALEAHLKGKRHQQNIAATSTEGDKNSMPKNVMAQEAKSHSMATADAGRSKARTFTAEQPVAQQTAEFYDHKLPDSNKAVPPSKSSHAEKSELTGITIPVKKLKPPMKWNCTICQVQATCEQNLQQHYAGQKHMSNIATLQKAKMAAEPSLGTEEKKTSSIKWSCSTCQAKGTSQSTLEAHLKGKRHQQNIVTATNVEGDKNGIPKNVVAQEAEPRSINVPKLLEKPPSVWSCSICEVICTCQTDLKNHLKGIRHRERVQSLHEQSKNKASDSESRKSKLIPDSRWICSICRTHCTCESDLENHLAGRRHQLNIQLLREKIKQQNNSPPQLAKNKEPTSELNCLMCEAKCNSESQFEAHCRSSRHQQKIQAILSKGNIAKGTSSRTKSEVPSDGSNSKDASSEKAVKQPTLYFCEVCNLLCESSTMLVHHRYGKKHRARLSARNELY